ncbi:MAG: hypothetical protein WD077_09210 [Bacteroidia bacterium]
MKKLIILLFPLLVLMACEKRDRQQIIPNVPVEVRITTNDPNYTDINILGSAVYIPGGYRGIILIHTFTDEYVAFDQACTHHINEGCAKVVLDESGIFMRCGQYGDTTFTACCTSRFRTDGSVMEGPAEYPLKAYRVNKSGALIEITNY